MDRRYRTTRNHLSRRIVHFKPAVCTPSAARRHGSVSRWHLLASWHSSHARRRSSLRAARPSVLASPVSRSMWAPARRPRSRGLPSVVRSASRYGKKKGPRKACGNSRIASRPGCATESCHPAAAKSRRRSPSCPGFAIACPPPTLPSSEAALTERRRAFRRRRPHTTTRTRNRVRCSARGSPSSSVPIEVVIRADRITYPGRDSNSYIPKDGGF